MKKIITVLLAAMLVFAFAACGETEETVADTTEVEACVGYSMQAPCQSNCRAFPGGPVVKNAPCNAGGHGFNSWSGKISHAVE